MSQFDYSDRSQASKPTQPTAGDRNRQAAADLSKAAAGLAVAGAEASIKTGYQIVKRLPFGRFGLNIAEATGTQLREQARKALGVAELEREILRLGNGSPLASSGSRQQMMSSLRERGADLLSSSADVKFHEEAHPAYVRILAEMSPDEARVLRHLARKGPQAALDVVRRTSFMQPPELIQSHLTLVAAEAGCRYTERIQTYFAHLQRHGLIEFSDQELPDLRGYQILDAQPQVTQALRQGGRGSRTARGRIALTELGADFCRICLPLDEGGITAEFDAV